MTVTVAIIARDEGQASTRAAPMLFLPRRGSISAGALEGGGCYIKSARAFAHAITKRDTGRFAAEGRVQPGVLP